MKRIAVLLASLVTAALVFVTTPAAQAADCEFAVNEVPGECVSEAVYLAVLDLRDQRDRARTDASNAWASAHDLRTQLWAQADLTQQARAEASMANSALGFAYSQIDYLNAKIKGLTHRVVVLRAKVKALQALV